MPAIRLLFRSMFIEIDKKNNEIKSLSIREAVENKLKDRQANIQKN